MGAVFGIIVGTTVGVLLGGPFFEMFFWASIGSLIAATIIILMD